MRQIAIFVSCLIVVLSLFGCKKAQNYAQTSVIEPVPNSEITSGRESETELPTKKKQNYQMKKR